MRKKLLALAINACLTSTTLANSAIINSHMFFSDELTIQANTKRQLVHLIIENTANQKQTLSLNLQADEQFWQLEYPTKLSVPAKTKVRFPIAIEITDLSALKLPQLHAEISANNTLLKSVPIVISNLNHNN